MRNLSRLPRFLLLLLLSMSVACSGGGGGSDDGSGSDEVIPPSDDGGGDTSGAGLRVTTFNTGLLPDFVPFSSERVDPIGRALAQHDTDVLCLQEVWQSQDVEKLKALRAQFPYLHVPAPRQKFASTAPVCTAADVEPIFSCVATNCVLSSEEFTQCMLRSCYDTVDALARRNPECASAIFAESGRSSSDIAEIQSDLFGSTPPGLFVFGGSSGIMLLSRFELQDVRELDFYDISTTSRRVAVFATVTAGGKTRKVGCTHLASNLDGVVPYSGGSGSWLGEANAQAARMVQFAAEYGGGDPVILAGDFNCSRANSSRGVAGDFEPVCGNFIGTGYLDPAFDSLSCTFCTSNPLNQMNAELAGNSDLLLDHLFLGNGAASAGIERVLTETIPLGGTTGALSDHYGVRVGVR